MAESKTDALRRMREANYSAAKGKPVKIEKPVNMETLKQIEKGESMPEPKKRGRKPGPKNIPATTPEAPKKKRGPYKPRKPKNEH